MGIFKTVAAAFIALLPFASRADIPQREIRPFPSFSKAVSGNMVFEIDPRIELLSGVQSMTSWVVSGRGPTARNAYFEELKAAFKGAAGSAAVRQSEALMKRGFTYDAPPAMALALEGGEAFGSPSEGWSDYLKGRSGGQAGLERFRSSLAEAYDAVGFRAFLEAHAADYRRWIDEATEGFEAGRISAWLEDYFGSDGPTTYHFVLAPAMFPGGGYGFSRSVGEGDAKRLHVYQIVRAQGSQDGEPGFPAGPSLASLALHEFGHSYVNPALEGGRIDRGLSEIFKPVRRTMERMAYGQVQAFLNELVLRAAVIQGERDIGLTTELDAEMEIRIEISRGFYPMRRVMALLDEYRSNRAAYPRFADFGPILLERLASQADAIVVEGRAIGYGGAGAAAPIPVDSFREGFDGMSMADLLRGFAIEVGSRISGGGGAASRVEIDASGSPGSGCLRLSSDSGTSRWYVVEKPISVQSGELSLRYRARAEGIRKEGAQYGGSYAGFILADGDGKKTFAVRLHSGSFGWESFEVKTLVDPERVKSIAFAVFLNESGTLWVDDIEAAYR